MDKSTVKEIVTGDKENRDRDYSCLGSSREVDIEGSKGL